MPANSESTAETAAAVENRDEMAGSEPEMIEAAEENDDNTSSEIGDVIPEGYLFLLCFRCASVDLIQFDQGLPQSLNPLKLANGIVITDCRCVPRVTSGWPDEEPNHFVQAFDTVRIHPSLMANSNVMRVAALVVGTRVEIMTCKDGVLYIPKSKIKEYVKAQDKILSMNMNALETGNKNEVVLPYLRGNAV